MTRRKMVKSALLALHIMLEVFDPARHTQNIAPSKFSYRSEEGFGHGLGSDAPPEALPL